VNHTFEVFDHVIHNHGNLTRVLLQRDAPARGPDQVAVLLGLFVLFVLFVLLGFRVIWVIRVIRVMMVIMVAGSTQRG
jgi:hypothetical protein